MDAFFAEHLACPYNHPPSEGAPRAQSALREEGAWLSCAHGHRFPVVDGIPVLLRDDAPTTIDLASASLEVARRFAGGDQRDAPWFVSTIGLTDEERAGILELAARDAKSRAMRVDPVASYLVGATNGILYKDSIGKLTDYPIPELRLPRGTGELLLDVGCSWGRWSIAAARKGYSVVGLDPSLGAVLAARRVSRRLGLSIRFVVGDARFLPFREGSFDRVFSYSVIQHFSREAAETAVASIGRVLRSRGEALVQMPNRIGVRCLYHQARRGFREPVGFEVRYWKLTDLRALFGRYIGPASTSVDGFFGLGIQKSDAPMMDPKRRAVLHASEVLRAATAKVPRLVELADSVYVHAVRS